MSRQSNDVFHRIPEEVFRKLIADSTSIRQVFIKMGLCVSGDQYKPFKTRVIELGIDLSHFHGSYDNKAERFKRELSVEKIFVINSHYAGGSLRKKLVKHSLLEYKCAKCSNEGFWQGEPITLQVDHINGDNSDNRLENLRFLCPNCHSQTPTYAGKRLKKHHHCYKCGKPRSAKAHLCKDCDRTRSTAILKAYVKSVSWPAIEMLKTLVWEFPLSVVAKNAGGSMGGLKKHCRKNHIECPPYGYWQRRAAGYNHEESLVNQSPVRSPKRLLSRVDLEQAAEMIRNGHSLREAADKVGFCHSTVMRALRRNNMLVESTAKRGRRPNGLKAEMLTQ